MGAKLVNHIRFVRQKKGDHMMYFRVPRPCCATPCATAVSICSSI